MKHVCRLAAIGLVMTLASAAPARAAGEDAGTTSANFLSLGSGAATLGMGGAGVARGGTMELLGWNAASLGHVREMQLAFSHAVVAEGTNQTWAAFGGLIGSSANRWALSGLYQGETGFEGRDASGNPTGNFDVSSMAFGAHVARPLGGIVTAGMGARYVGEKLGDVSGSGFSMDLGLQARVGPMALGAALQNAFGRMNYDGSDYPMPENVVLGAAFDVPGGVTLAADWNLPKAYYQDVRVGVEYRYLGLFAVRGGWREELGAPSDEGLSGPSFGMGAGWSGVWLDYGYVLEGEGDGQHRIGMTFRPGRAVPGTGLLGDADAPKSKPTPRTSAVEKAKDEDRPPATAVTKPTAKPAAAAPVETSPAKRVAEAKSTTVTEPAPTAKKTATAPTSTTSMTAEPAQTTPSVSKAVATNPTAEAAKAAVPAKPVPAPKTPTPSKSSGAARLAEAMKSAGVDRGAKQDAPIAESSTQAPTPAKPEAPAKSVATAKSEAPAKSVATAKSEAPAKSEASAKSETPTPEKSKLTEVATDKAAAATVTETPAKDTAAQTAKHDRRDKKHRKTKVEPEQPAISALAKASAAADDPTRVLEVKKPKFGKLVKPKKSSKKKVRTLDDAARDAEKLAKDR